MKNYNNDICRVCTTNYGSIHVQNVAHGGCFSSWVEWVCEFLNQENLAIDYFKLRSVMHQPKSTPLFLFKYN